MVTCDGWRSGEGGRGICSGNRSLVTDGCFGAESSLGSGLISDNGFVLNNGSDLGGPVCDIEFKNLSRASTVEGNCVLGRCSKLKSGLVLIGGSVVTPDWVLGSASNLKRGSGFNDGSVLAAGSARKPNCALGRASNLKSGCGLDKRPVFG